MATGSPRTHVTLRVQCFDKEHRNFQRLCDFIRMPDFEQPALILCCCHWKTFALDTCAFPITARPKSLCDDVDANAFRDHAFSLLRNVDVSDVSRIVGTCTEVFRSRSHPIRPHRNTCPAPSSCRHCDTGRSLRPGKSCLEPRYHRRSDGSRSGIALRMSDFLNITEGEKE